MLYKPLFHLSSHLRQLYISKRQSSSVLKVGMVYMGTVHISRYLKENLVLATDKRLQVISNVVLFITVMYNANEPKNKAILSLK